MSPGNRDIVGYGFNGNPVYMDRVEFPAPAIRFKENTSDVLALREKEMGDWNSLSLDEKKQCKLLPGRGFSFPNKTCHLGW